jgi:DNA-binding MarR family transcriptional regulator
MTRISGTDLRNRLLARMERPREAPATEQMRIEALSSVGNRDLLGIVAAKQPRSVGELAALAGRLQPNVSRSLTALARAGLLTVVSDGRASVPTLTPEGRQKAEALGFVGQVISSEKLHDQIGAADGRVLTAKVAEPSDDGSATDAVQADVTVHFPVKEGQLPLTAHSSIDLTEVCRHLLANWWRITCRRGDPVKMFPVYKETTEGASQAILLTESTGPIALFIRSIVDDGDAWGFPRLSLAAEDFKNMVFDDLVRPLVAGLRTRRRFGHTVESLLQRTEEIYENQADLGFWRTAGALGLSYATITDPAATDVGDLINAISNEDARLDLASASTPSQIRESLAWIRREIDEKAEVNSLPKLFELRQEAKTAIAAKPYLVGTRRARAVRGQLKLNSDRSVGEIASLATMFGGDKKFKLSPAGEELLRGHQGHRNDTPVMVVKDEGPKSTAFLMSRAIGDYSIFGSRDASVVDIYSDRQAVGRAFAAEFMAPAEGVVRMVEQEGVPLDTVADHYGVVRKVVQWQYENNVAKYAA